MRYSDGVAKYSEEKKKSILNAVIDSDNAVSSAENREEITMTTNGQARIKSKKSGLIAAACAALIIGGGSAAYFSMKAPDKEVRTSPAASAPQEELSDSNQGSQSMTFMDMVENTDAIFEGEITEIKVGALTPDGMVFDASKKDVENADSITKTDSFGNYFQCTVKINGIAFVYSDEEVDIPDEITFIMPVDTENIKFDNNGEESSTVGMKVGDRDLFFLRHSELPSVDWEPTAVNSVFEYDNSTHSYKNDIEEGVYEDEITDYMLNYFSYEEKEFVTSWADYHEEPYTIEYGFSNAAPGCVIHMEYSDDHYVITLQPEGPEAEQAEKEETEAAETEEAESEDPLGVGLKVDDHGKIVEGFEGLDIKISELWYVPDNHIYGIAIDVSATDGSPLPWGYDSSAMTMVYDDLTPFMEATDADSVTMLGGWAKEGEPNTMRFLISTEPKTDADGVDQNAEIFLGINAITDEEGNEVATGRFEAHFHFDLNNKLSDR